jgi:NAD(P)H-flavin reductase
VSQAGLKDTQRAQRCFLSCRCFPNEDLTLARVDAGSRYHETTIHSIEALNDTIARVTVDCTETYTYFPGQFTNFVHDGTIRSFSLASVPALHGRPEFHVAHFPGGKMSGWIHTKARPGDTLTIMDALGSCFYVPGKPDQPLLLLGTGTGLAPLYGILRDALHQNHEGPIHLFHGGLTKDRLYLVDNLQSLQANHANFQYYPCVLEGSGEGGIFTGNIDETVFEHIPELKGWRVFLCGDPLLVRAMQRKCFMAGAALADIAADAFLTAAGD